MADNNTPPSLPEKPNIDLIANEVISTQGVDKSFEGAGFGASIDFAGKDIDRYLTYGAATYGKLGYDPFRDNSDFYNQNTTAGKDIQRAFDGMWKLAGVGFKDTFAFGAFASDQAHKEFEQVMDNYGSTRKGTAGFIANTMLSSGYTVGIMTAIAAEELLLAGATALTGGMAAPVTLAEATGTAAHGLSMMERMGKGVQSVDRMIDKINVFKKVENARALWVGRQVKGFGKQLLPLGETMDVLRNLDRLKDLNGLQKTLHGVGAFARDMRKIYMTHAESKLEANLAKDEVKETLINQWRKDHVGEIMSDDVLSGIEAKANEAYRLTYNGNLGLIYATNAITFDAMFKSMRLTNKMFGLHESLQYTVKKTGGKIAVEALEDTMGNYFKKEISKLTWKGTVKKTLASSMEGFQEIGQDAISGTAKSYVGAGDSKLEGNYWDSFYHSLGEMEGESFLSGMLMGTFASPVGMSIQAVNKFAIGGGHRAITDPLGYNEAKESAYKEAKRKAKVLEKFFNESGSYTDFANHPLFAQAIANEQMTQAAEEGDRKIHEDKRNEAFKEGLKLLLETGTEGELIDYLNDMGNYTVDELNQAANRTDITEENKADFLQKVENYKNKIKEFKKDFDEINDRMVNPISIQSLSADDPEFLEKKMVYHAHEKMKDDMLFSKDRFRELIGRSEELRKSVVNDKFTDTHLNTILRSSDIKNEIKALETDIASNKEYDVAVEDIAPKEKKLAALKKMQAAMEKYDELGTDIEETEAVYDEMFEAWNEYYNSVTGHEESTGTRFANKQDFQKVWDYLNLKGESDVLQEHINSMNDPVYAARQIQRIKERLKEKDKNKRTVIENSLKAFYGKKVSDDLISQMLKEDMVFDHKEIDDLIQRGIMPKKFFDIKTHQELSGERLARAQEIVSANYKRLTGKTITAKDAGYKTRKKAEADTRTSKGLIREFGNSKKDTPIAIKTFVKKLVRSKYLGNTEREILNTLIETGMMKDQKIVLTESGDAPIEIDKNGNIVIDVRFSGSDYTDGDTSFEYLGVSAILQTHFNKQLEDDAQLESDVRKIMNNAKDGMLIQEGDKMNRATADNIPVFNNTAIFLSEVMNNPSFREFLTEIENTVDAEGRNLFESIREIIGEQLDEDFDGTLLDRAIDLVYLSLNDREMRNVLEESPDAAVIEEETPKSETTETVIDNTPEGELSEIERLENQISEVTTELRQAKRELNRTAKMKWKKYNATKRAVTDLELQLEDLESELAAAKDREIVKTSTPVQTATNSVEIENTVDDTGKQVIGKKSAFSSLPIELQIRLADLYFKEKFTEEEKNQAPKATTTLDVNQDFDAGDVGVNPMSNLNKLTAEDIDYIQSAMQSNFRYIEEMAAFRQEQNNPKTVKPVVEAEVVEVDTTDTEEETEEEEREIPVTSSINSELLIFAIPGIRDVLSEKQIENRVQKLNAQKTQDDFGNVMNQIANEVTRLLAKKTVSEREEKDTWSANTVVKNWTRNQEVLENRVFVFNKKRYSLTEADVDIFKQRGHMSLPAAEFDQLLGEWLRDTRNMAKVYRKGGVGSTILEQINTGTALYAFANGRIKTGLISSGMASAINADLKANDIPLKLRYDKKLRRFRVETPKAEPSIKSKLSKVGQIRQDLFDHFEYDGVNIWNRSQAELEIYDWLSTPGNKVHPDAIPVRNETRAYTSKNSPHKSVDGLADVIFSNIDMDRLENILGMSPASLVEEILLNYRTVNDLRDDLVDQMNREKRMMDEMEAGGTEEGEFTTEEIEAMQLEAELREQYYNSVTYLVANNAFNEDPNTLSPSDRLLYDVLQTLKAKKSKQIDKEIIRLDKEVRSKEEDRFKYDYTRNIIKKLLTQNVSLTSVVGLYQLVTNPINNITPKQQALLIDNIIKQLGVKDNIGRMVATQDAVVKIIGFDKGQVIIQRIDTGKVLPMSPRDFLAETTAVLEIGTEFDPSGTDSTVTKDDAQLMGDAIAGIFNKFTESMSEVQGMTNKDLVNNILEQLTKCKS